MAFYIFPMKEGERSLDIFKIVGKIALEGSEQFDKDVSNAKGKGVALASAIGNGLATAAKIGSAAIGAASTAIGFMAKESLDKFAEYEQLVGGSKLLFGDAYEYVAEQAKTAYKDVQMSQNEYLQQVNGFATGLKTALGGNEQAAAELAAKIIKAEADVVAATGNSQEAVQNAFNGIMKSNFTMLDNLQLGITPTKEGFQTLIEQVNAYNRTLGKTTNYQIDNLADCQSALVDYIAMQNLSGYAANEAAGSIQGSLAMVKASWQDLLVGFADSSQDLDALISNLVDSATTAARLIVPKLAEILGGMTTAMAEIMPVVCAELPVLMEELLPGIIEGAVGLVAGLVAVAPDLVNSLIGAINQFITEKLPQMFPGLAENLSAVQGYFADIGNYVKETFAPIMGDLQTAFDNVKDKVQPVIDKLKDYIKSGEAAEDASNLLKDAADFLAEVYATVKDLINDTVIAFQDACIWVEEHALGLEILASALGVVATALGVYTIAQAIANAGGIAMVALNASTTVGYYALVAAETVATAATTAFGAAMAFVTSPVTLVVAAIAAVIAIIVLCVKHWDEIKAKAIEIAGVISEKWNEIKEAVSEKVASMLATVTSKFQEIKATVESKVNDVKTKVQETFENIKTAIQDAMDQAKEKVSQIWEDIKSVFSDAVSVGKQLIDDIKQGINNAWEGLKSWFSDLWNGLFGNLTANITVNKRDGTGEHSNATGLNFVPYDGYNTTLHHGEAVLNAVQARAWRRGEVPSNVSQDTTGVLLMILDAIQEGNSHETVLTLNNREFGRAVRRVVNA